MLPSFLQYKHSVSLKAGEKDYFRGRGNNNFQYSFLCHKLVLTKNTNYCLEFFRSHEKRSFCVLVK